MLKQLSIIITSLSILHSFFTELYSQSPLKLSWSIPFEKEVRAIWNISQMEHLIVASGNIFFLLNKSDGKIIGKKEYKDWNYALIVKEKGLLIFIDNFRLRIIDPFNDSEVILSALLQEGNRIEYIDAMDALLILQGPTLILINIKDGQLLWRAILKSQPGTIIDCAYDDNNQNLLVFMHTGFNAIFASIDPSDGRLKWEYKINDLILNIHASKSSNRVIKDDNIYLELGGGLSKVNYITGEQEWFVRYATYETIGSLLEESVLLNASAPPIIKQDAIITAAKGVIRSIDLVKGKVKWQSQDYGLVPVLFTQGDTLFAVTGGIFSSVTIRKAFSDLFPAAATGKLGEIWFPWLDIKSIDSDVRHGTELLEIENISVKELESSLKWSGTPGLIACNLTSGAEFYKFEAEEDLSGVFIDFPLAILGDSKRIYEINLKTGESRIAVPIAELQLGEYTRYLLKHDNNEYIIITAKANGQARGHYIARILLNNSEPLWLTRLSEEVKTKGKSVKNFPQLLAHKENQIYLMLEGELFAIDTSNGNINWREKIHNADEPQPNRFNQLNPLYPHTKNSKRIELIKRINFLFLHRFAF